MLDDFHSTDLAGAAYYAAIYSKAFEVDVDRPSWLEAEMDEALLGDSSTDRSNHDAHQ